MEPTRKNKLIRPPLTAEGSAGITVGANSLCPGEEAARTTLGRIHRAKSRSEVLAKGKEDHAREPHDKNEEEVGARVRVEAAHEVEDLHAMIARHSAGSPRRLLSARGAYTPSRSTTR